MFGRHIEVKLVKTPKTQTIETETKITPEEIKAVANDILKKVAIATAATAGFIVAVSAIADITVNSIDNHQKNKKDN